MNKIVKKVFLVVLFISLSTTNTYPIFGFDYIKRFFVSTTSSLVTNVRQTFTSLFNIFRRRNKQQIQQLRAGINQFEINRLREMNRELEQHVETLDQQVEDHQHQLQDNVEARRNHLQKVGEDLQERDRRILDQEREVSRLRRGNAADCRELQQKNEELQQKDEELQGANEGLRVASEINEGYERQFEQIRERQNEIGQLWNLGSVTNRRLQQKDEELQQRSEELKKIANENLLMMQEDFASQSRENEHARLSAAKIEVSRQIKKGRQVLPCEEDKLQRQEANDQQAINQSKAEENEGLNGSEENDEFDQAEKFLRDKGKEEQGEVCIHQPQPGVHFRLVEAGFIKLIKGFSGAITAVPGDNNPSASIIGPFGNDHGNDAGNLENIGSSSDSLQKDELSDNWSRVDDDKSVPMRLYGNYAFYKTTISPSKAGNKKIIFACVHGTFANPSSCGADIAKKTTRDLRSFAEVLSKSFDCTVELVSFKWSGVEDIKHREEAGNILGDYFLIELEKNPQIPIWTFAHSHGANVVNFAAKRMKERDTSKSIDYAIHLASPVQDLRDSNGHFLPLNIKTLYHFYGIHDNVQPFGSARSEGKVSGLFKRKYGYNTYPGMLFHNIRFKKCGKDVNHFDIKEVAKSLPSLLFKIEDYYRYHSDLIANVSESGFAWQVAINGSCSNNTFIDNESNEEYFKYALQQNKNEREDYFRREKHPIEEKFYEHSWFGQYGSRALSVVSEAMAAAKGPLGLK